MIGQRTKQKLLNRLVEGQAATNMTHIIASVEHELLEAAAPLDDALDLGHVDDDLPDVEERQEALKGLLRATVNDEMRSLWIDDVLPGLVDNPDRAEQYVGMDPDDWREQIQRWAASYRDAGAEGSDGDLAAEHVRRTFGVDMETFERRVVEFDPGTEAERLFAANFRAVRDVLRDAAEEVDRADE